MRRIVRVAVAVGIAAALTSPAYAQGQGATTPQQGAAPPQVAFEYSDAYRLRAKIHKVASFTMLPLMATEGILGQSLYSDPGSGKKDAHLAVAAGIGALFAVNTRHRRVEPGRSSQGPGAPWAAARPWSADARRGCGLSRHGGARARRMTMTGREARTAPSRSRRSGWRPPVT